MSGVRQLDVVLGEGRDLLLLCDRQLGWSRLVGASPLGRGNSPAVDGRVEHTCAELENPRDGLLARNCEVALEPSFHGEVEREGGAADNTKEHGHHRREPADSE
jgi:hypothetical protein